jgi:dienelactone hydrolase
MKKSFIALLLFVPVLSFADIQTKTVSYQHNGTPLEGIVVYDDSTAVSRPGVLVVHAWMGIDDHVKERAQRLAKMGYIAFCADIYGKGVRPASVEEAARTSSIYKKDRALFRGRLKAGLEELKKQKNIDTTQLMGIGFCFGGTGVLELARSGAKIDGVVSFHGGLDSPTPSDGKNIKAKVLVLHGADDPYSSPENIAAFENEMRASKVDWEMIKYGNAVHSFTDKSAGNDNSKGAAYNATADERSWQAMKDFFAEIRK